MHGHTVSSSSVLMPELVLPHLFSVGLCQSGSGDAFMAAAEVWGARIWWPQGKHCPRSWGPEFESWLCCCPGV